MTKLVLVAAAIGGYLLYKHYKSDTSASANSGMISELGTPVKVNGTFGPTIKHVKVFGSRW